MRRYFTGLLLCSHEGLLEPLQARGWNVASEQKLDDEVRRGSVSNTEEIVIYAKSAERAQAALTLIVDAWTVLNGVLSSGDDLVVIPADPQERKTWKADSIFHPRGIWSTSGFPLSCLVAQRASMKRKFVYAMTLCRQSLALHCNEIVDLDPALFPYKHRSINPRDHVRYAYAIVTAYAVLEQLGLSLHGECFRDGKWIKEKREELEARLRKAGINLGNSLHWMMRGGKSQLEAKRPPTVIRKCSWAYGSVRDCNVAFVDGVADLRWFRSRVAAHDIDSLASVLSVHDVLNGQEIACRAVLESLGFDDETISGLYHDYGFKAEQAS